MRHPLIFVTTHSVNDGELDRLRQLGDRFTQTAAEARGLQSFHLFLSEDGGEISNVHVHEDAASMDAYLPLVRERIEEALQLSRTSSIDVFGTPGPLLRSVLRHNEEQGVAVRVRPAHVAGFTR